MYFKVFLPYFYVFLVVFLIIMPVFVFAQSNNLTILGYDLNCDPALSPADDGCGIAHFILLIKKIIDFLTIIVFPIAAGVIIWGGIVIMTAGGSVERAGKGKKIVTTAVIGVAIALGSWLIINAIYLALTGRGV